MEPALGLLPGLLTGIVALALAGLAHCSAMCGMPCAVILGQRPVAAAVAFHAARAVSYSLAGALLAGGIAQLGDAVSLSRAFGPLWTLWHVAGLAWGAWMLIHARQPVWLERWLAGGPRVVRMARLPLAAAATQTVSLVAAGAQRQAAVATPRPWADIWAAASAGLAWVAWPCGLLHSALLLASLSGSTVAGATLMIVFAAISGVGMIVAPSLWRRIGEPGVAAKVTRIAGLMLVLSCLWALAARTGFADWCLSHL